MDFSKLDQNERLAVFGSIAVFLAGIISNWGGLLFLSLLAAIVMAIIVFLPQVSPGTSLPGSKGSLMAATGFVAAGGALITLLQWIGFITAFGFNSIMFLIALVGSLVMAWAGWQELQAEGGTWRFGSETTGTAAAPAATTDAHDHAHDGGHDEAHDHGHDHAHDEHHAEAGASTDPDHPGEERRTEA